MTCVSFCGLFLKMQQRNGTQAVPYRWAGVFCFILECTATKTVAVCFFLCYNYYITIKEVFSMLAHCSLETAGEVPAK